MVARKTKDHINLGCGRDYMDGYDNIDIASWVRADYRLDIRSEHLPHKANSVKFIYAHCVFEQILTNEDFRFAINECYRVLEPGGVLMIGVPDGRHVISIQDPFDCRRFTPASFDYFLVGTQHYENYGKTYGLSGWTKVEIAETSNHLLKVRLTK